MKAAFWGIGLIVLGLLGVVLINLFGNITVTNQLNYTTMKNAVEASMYDAVNQKYISGFCLCTDKDKTDGKYVFTNQNEYDLVDVTNVDGKMTCESARKNCVVLEGERRIDKQVFAESFVRRFAEMVNNNKYYEIVFQEIIEYPPKVSVGVYSKDDEFLPTDKREGYTIVNQIDSIIETWGETQIAENVSTPTPTPVPNATTVTKPTATPKTTTAKKACYRKIVGKIDEDKYAWTDTNPGTGWELLSTVTKEKDCYCGTFYTLGWIHVPGDKYLNSGDGCGSKPSKPVYHQLTYKGLTGLGARQGGKVYDSASGTKDPKTGQYKCYQVYWGCTVSGGSGCEFTFEGTVTLSNGTVEKLKPSGGYAACNSAYQACVTAAKSTCSTCKYSCRGYRWKTSFKNGVAKDKGKEWCNASSKGDYCNTIPKGYTCMCGNRLPK